MPPKPSVPFIWDTQAHGLPELFGAQHGGKSSIMEFGSTTDKDYNARLYLFVVCVVGVLGRPTYAGRFTRLVDDGTAT